MTRKSIVIVLILVSSTLIGCQQQRIRKVAMDNESLIRTFVELQSYQVAKLDLDYIAKCRIRIKAPRLDQNGSCQIVITHDNHFQILMFSPVGGTLLMVYQDDDQIQVLNYHDRTFMQLKNNEKNRDKAFEIVNLNVAEFRSIFWGREIGGDETQLDFFYERDKPAQIRKRGTQSEQLVTIKKWLRYQGAWFPKTIDFRDDMRSIYLKVVVTSFSPGLTDKLVPAVVPEGFQIRY